MGSHRPYSNLRTVPYPAASNESAYSNRTRRSSYPVNQTEPQESPQGPAIGDIRRIFGFVVDDLTIRFEDLAYIRSMLTNFIDNQMQPTDLVAIVRTVGGKGLLHSSRPTKPRYCRSHAPQSRAKGVQ